MHIIKNLRAGEFIDLDNYFREIIEEDYTNVEKFYLLLLDELPKDEQGYSDVMQEFIKEMTSIKEEFSWIFNPPQMPTEADQKQPTIGDEYRKDFAQDYGLYTEIIYLLSKGDPLKVDEVMKMKCEDFLYWAEYLLRKRFVEAIK